MLALIRTLFPFYPSITGDGVRITLRILKRFIPLNVHEVPTGTQVFDWSVPISLHTFKDRIHNVARTQ